MEKRKYAYSYQFFSKFDGNLVMRVVPLPVAAALQAAKEFKDKKALDERND